MCKYIFVYKDSLNVTYGMFHAYKIECTRNLPKKFSCKSPIFQNLWQFSFHEQNSFSKMFYEFKFLESQSFLVKPNFANRVRSFRDLRPQTYHIDAYGVIA